MADGSQIEKKGITPAGELDGSGLRIGIVHTRWNAQVVDALVTGAEGQLVRPCRWPALVRLRHGPAG